MVHWEKQNVMLCVLSFKKEAAHRFTRSYGFLTHQLLKMNLPTLRLLRKQ